MRYINTIYKAVLTCIVLAFTLNLNAQNNTNSPFSSFGLGEMRMMDHPSYSALGNTYLTHFDSTQLNFLNPASYNTLGAHMPLFSLGLSARLSYYSENDRSYFNNTAYLSNLVLAFPIHKHFGFAFGLKPYSSKGYDFSTRAFVYNDSIEYTYKGKGTISEAFVGLSSDLLKLNKTRISYIIISPEDSIKVLKTYDTRFAVGSNLGYLFGGIENQRFSALKDDNYNSGGGGTRDLYVKAFHYEIGTYLTHSIKNSYTKKVHTFTLAGKIDPSQKLNAKYSSGIYYVYDIAKNDPTEFDTLSFQSSEGSIQMPASYSLGLSYALRFSTTEKVKEKTREISFHLGYDASNWSAFSYDYDTMNYSLLNTSNFSFGLQFLPETDYLRRAFNTKFFEQIRYKAGYYQRTLPYAIGNTQISEYGFTFGFGIPVIVGKWSASHINIGFTVGNRGAENTQYLSEKFYGINFGMIIAPEEDRWFRKVKYN